MGLGGTCLGTQVWDLSPWVPPRPGRGRARESGTGVETNCRSCMCVICKWALLAALGFLMGPIMCKASAEAGSVKSIGHSEV